MTRPGLEPGISGPVERLLAVSLLQSLRGVQEIVGRICLFLGSPPFNECMTCGSDMTRPGLEPGISGSGGRRLIH